MSEPIKIVVTAETAAAAANLQQFAAGVSQNAQAVNKAVAESAVATGQHIGGMVYQFRSAMDAVRFAAMDGGPRAAFYAVDEALRALVASGLKLSAVVPYLGAIAVAAGAGAYVWNEYANAQSRADEATKNMVDSLDRIPALLEKINKLRDAGLLTPAGAQQMSDEATKRKPLYVDHTGQVTPQSTDTYEAMVQTQMGYSPAMSSQLQTVTRQNRPATQDEITKYEESKVDEISTKNAEALAKFRELEKEVNKITAEGSLALDKQLADINAKYDNLVKNIKDAANAAGAPLSDGMRDSGVDAAAAADIAKLQADRQRDIDKANADAAQKNQEEQSRALNEQARALKDQIDQINREMGEELATEKKQSEELDHQTALRREIADEAIRLKMAELQNRDDLSPDEKAAAMEKLLQDESDIYQVQINQLTTSLEQTTDLTKQLDLQKEILRLKIEQAQLVPKEDKEDKTFGGQFGDQWDNLQKKVDNIAGDISSVAMSPLVGLNNGLDSAFTKLFEKGETTKQFFGQVYMSIAQSFDQALAKMLSDFVTNQAMQLLKAIATQTGLTAIFSAGTEARTAIHAEGESQMSLYTMIGTLIRKGWHLAETVYHGMMTAIKTSVHAAGEGQQTIFTMLGSIARQAWHLAETVFHGVMTAIRVAAHLTGETICTGATEAGAAIRAVYYAIVAAIAAIASLASVPYVGVVLGIAAGAAVMAAAEGMMGGFRDGGYTGSGAPDEIAGVVHRGEFVMPASAVSSIGLGNLESLRSGSRDSSSMPDAGRGNSTKAPQHRTDSFIYFDSNKMMDHLQKSDAHEKMIVDIMGRNIHKFR